MVSWRREGSKIQPYMGGSEINPEKKCVKSLVQLPCAFTQQPAAAKIDAAAGVSQFVGFRVTAMPITVGKVPNVASQAVADFVRLHRLTHQPVILAYQPSGFGQDWCHISAKHQALTCAGRRVHGWALWEYSSDLIIGDFHSVWFDGNNLIDVTPPKFGSEQVLFVPDTNLSIYTQDGIIVFQTNRSNKFDAPYWWNGSPTNDRIWGTPVTNPQVQKYCAYLGFDISRIDTDQSHG